MNFLGRVKSEELEQFLFPQITAFPSFIALYDLLIRILFLMSKTYICSYDPIKVFCVYAFCQLLTIQHSANYAMSEFLILLVFKK